MKSQRDGEMGRWYCYRGFRVEVAVSQIWCCLSFLTVLSLQAGGPLKTKGGRHCRRLRVYLEPPATQWTSATSGPERVAAPICQQLGRKQGRCDRRVSSSMTGRTWSRSPTDAETSGAVRREH